MKQRHTYREIGLFGGLTVGLSALFYALILPRGGIESGGSMVAGIMLTPGLAAIATQLIMKRTLRGLGWRIRLDRYLAAGYLLPAIYCLVAYTMVWMTGLGGFLREDTVARRAAELSDVYGIVGVSEPLVIPIYVLVMATLGVLINCTVALGEELGWRGFLVPALARVASPGRAALLAGALHVVWHYPGIVFADYNNGTPVWFALACFTVLWMSLAIPLALLRFRSQSVWPAVVLHASHNLFVQNVFDTFTRDTGATAYVTGEFGFALALVALVVAAFSWRRLGESKGQHTASTSVAPALILP